MIFHNEYRSILQKAIESDVELNERTGENIKVIEYPVSLTIDLRDRKVPTVGLRKTFPKSAAAEIAWFLMGTKDAAFIEKYAPFWNKFIEKIDNKNIIESSYGYRWRKHFGRDQIQEALEALKIDPTNRRVYISAWDPQNDGLMTQNQLNVPCPVGFSLSIVKGKLNSALHLRSSDIFVGLPYDIMGHAYLMDAIASSLNIDIGYMSVSMSHAHLYESHWEHTLEALNQKFVVPDIKLPGKSIEYITENPDEYVLNIIEESKLYHWPIFNPKPHVVSIKEHNDEIKEYLKKNKRNSF